MLADPERLRKAIRAERCRRSLAEFFRQGWHVLEPDTHLDWNWHIEAVCAHIQSTLEDWGRKQDDPAYEQRITNLLINIPPGTAKSRITSVYAPAWMWLHRPSWKGIFLSANPRVALRDSGLCRDLLESEWYRDTFSPSWDLADDQNAKSLYNNTRGGFRQALGWYSKITGDRADAIFVDDPHDADEVHSDVIRVGVLDRWRDAICNRVNDNRSSVRIGIMQRVHEADWSAFVLESGDWAHLCLPMEYEPERATTTPIGWTDPRTEPGELLFPVRFPREFLEKEKHPTRLGAVGYAGQHQQRPAPADGGLFRTGNVRIVEAIPAGCSRVRYWDKAGTAGGGDYSCGVKLARSREGFFFVEHVRRGQWSAGERERIIRQTAETDGRDVAVWVEQEPGSGGKESAESTVRSLAGFTVRAERVTGDKATRARPLAAQVEAGNVAILKDDVSDRYVLPFLDELRIFPNGRHDDQVDAVSGAFHKLADGNFQWGFY